MLSTYIYLPITGVSLYSLLLITTIVSVISVILTLGLLYIYLKNYKEYNASFSLGLVYFAAFFLIVTIFNLISQINQLMAMYPAELFNLIIVYAQFIGTLILFKTTYQT